MKRISVAQPVLDGNESQYVLECLQENWISSRGKYIERFEALLAEHCGTKHAVVTCNGTTSLHLALVAMGIEPGDEIIMPTLSYVATANAAHYCGATPVFVDCEPNYFSMDPDKVEEAITSRTKAIMTVPLYGHPVDMDPIAEIAERYQLDLIEDSAESIGAFYKERPVGSLARCSSFSFFGNKTITTGEGGALTTDDDRLAERLRFLRGQAVDPKKNYWHPEVGFNYRMTNIAAAIGTAQAERLDVHVGRRQRVAEWYEASLGDLVEWIKPAYVADWAVHSFWMYTVQIRKEAAIDRDLVIAGMAQRGIETRPVFYPIHTMPVYKRPGLKFPVSEQCSSLGISLPTHGALTREDVETVCCELRSVLLSLRQSRRMAA